MARALEFQQAPPTVLLVDDDEMLRRLLARTLRNESFRVVEAENGEAALRLVAGLDYSVGLVLTDILMPIMDGLKFARLFRSRYPGIPILFMSGALPYASEGTPLREVGTHLLLKPFGPDVLLEAISAILSQERRSVRRAPA